MKLKSKEDLVQLEVDLDGLYSLNHGGFELEEERALVVEQGARKLVLLEQEVDTWCQKSRATWLACGDRNTKFFHSFSNFRRQVNSIWDIRKEDGTLVSRQQDLEKETLNYFQNMFKAWENLSIFHQLEVIQVYPRLFYEEEGQMVADLVSFSEVQSALEGFSVSKSLGPDGWTVEFFFGIL